MKRFLHIALLLLPVTCFAQISEDVLKKYSGLGLPMVCIATVHGEEPTSTNIQHPEGCIGASITDIVPKEGRMHIYRADTLWYDSGKYQEGVSGMVIKHRGNTSAYHYRNKPFKITLEKKADLIITPEDDDTDRRSKHWVLLNCSFSIRSYFISQVARLIDMEYAPRVEYVNVFINNNYRGVYILSENVRRDKCRVNVDMEEGYIIELNAYYWNEPFSIPSKLVDFMQWTLKYPKPEDLTEEQESNIRSDIERFEQAVSSDNYPEVIDVQSFARWMLTHDILGNRDGAGSNMFLTKYDDSDTTLLRMDCLWDLDVIMESEGWDELHDRYFFGRMFHNSNRAFADCYIALWDELKDQVTDGILQFLDDYLQSELCQAVDTSIGLNNDRWALEQYALPFSADFIEKARNWFLVRRGWLDDAIHDPVSISPVLQNKDFQQFYDLFGRKITSPQSPGRHAIYIQNGKKMLKK